jgi:uncharacterized protein with HEPN domain
MRDKDPIPRLHDILWQVEGLRRALAGNSFEDFQGNWVLRLASERALEIISEASRHIPEPLKQTTPKVQWREIAAIGNVLRHAYHRVEPRIVYTIATEQLDDLESAARRILATLEPK